MLGVGSCQDLEFVSCSSLGCGISSRIIKFDIVATSTVVLDLRILPVLHCSFSISSIFIHSASCFSLQWWATMNLFCRPRSCRVVQQDQSNIISSFNGLLLSSSRSTSSALGGIMPFFLQHIMIDGCSYYHHYTKGGWKQIKSCCGAGGA